jgi:Protein of unknown function (DUF1569)
MHAVLERVVSQISSEVLGLDAETTQLHPNGLDNKWSAQQVVEHLVLGYRLTSNALENRLNKGRPSRNQRTYLQWSLQLMVLSFGKLPRGVPALEETMPVAGGFSAMDGQQLGELTRREIDAMDTMFDRCRQKFGMERVAVHPFLGPLRVDQWRRFHVVHGMHHLVQLRSIVAQVALLQVPVSLPSPKLVEKLQVPAQRPLT